jgi:PAS domain S-box-containing protein
MIRDAEGNPKKIAVMARDITERKKAEEELRQSEARYKTLFMGSVEGILVIDLETRRFCYANPAACRMFQYTEKEMRELSVMDLHPKESRDQMMAEFGAHARNEKMLTPAAPCRRKDGTVFYAEIKTTPIVLDGRQCHMGFIQDITERRCAAEKEKELVAVAAEAAGEKKRADEIEKVCQELREKSERLERFQRVAVGQELEMVRLEEEVNAHLEKSGLPRKYETPGKIKKRNESIALASHRDAWDRRP